MATVSHELAHLIPEDLRAHLSRRELRLRRPVAGRHHGGHRSRRAGLGQDFREHRAYTPGDDIRQVDWRAAARRERLVMRLAEGEEQLTVFLLVDAGANMAYAAQEEDFGKWDAVKAIAAALATIVIRQGDRVGFALGRSARSELDGVSASSSHDRLRALGHALEAPPAGRCPWFDLFDGIAPALTPRSLIIAISDFLDPDPERSDADEALTSGFADFVARGHDVVLLQLLHADEVQFPWSDRTLMRFEDPRRVRDAIEGPGGRLREDYIRRFREHQEALERRCELGGLHRQTVMADADRLADAIVDTLSRLSGAPRAVVAGSQPP